MTLASRQLHKTRMMKENKHINYSSWNHNSWPCKIYICKYLDNERELIMIGNLSQLFISKHFFQEYALQKYLILTDAQTIGSTNNPIRLYECILRTTDLAVFMVHGQPISWLHTIPHN